MNRKFNFDSTGATFAIVILTPGFLMIAFGFIGFSSIVQTTVSLIVGLGVLFLLWYGLARGTYVCIQDNTVHGRFLFIKGKVTSFGDIISIHPRATFGGIMTEVYFKYRKGSDVIGERGLVNKQSLKKKDFMELMKTIQTLNPEIQIADELLK